MAYTLKDGTVLDFKHLTLAQMIAYMEENTSAKELPAIKEWFKGVAIVNDKYNHLKACREFCGKYCPELLPPKAEPKAKTSEMLANW